jgi:hypothetical protein
MINTNINRLQTLFARIDEANQQDPNIGLSSDNNMIAKEVLYSQRMQYRLKQFAPEANEALQIAAYSQHIQRWKIPRDHYPMDRAGYKRWRTDLGKFHAATTAEIMQQVGYNSTLIERVEYLLQKKGLKRDSDTQTLEDVICLVFLEYYLDDFAAKHDADKIVSIIQKTWAKMSTEGHAAALTLPLESHLSALVAKALA